MVQVGIINPTNLAQVARLWRFHMSIKAIHYDEKMQDWQFPYDVFTTEQIGAKIANSLHQGEELVEVGGGVKVTVNYLLEMLRFRSKYGWFYDATDICLSGQDHDFDPNHITPTARWGEVQGLKAAIRRVQREEREYLDQERIARSLGQDNAADQIKQDAGEMRKQIAALRLQVHELLSPPSA